MMRWLGLLIAMLIVPGTAHASWHRAESPNFIVYMDEDESGIREYVERLEQYSHLVRILMGADPNVPSAKLRVFVVRSARHVGQFLSNSRNVAGYYVSSARGPYTVVPERTIGHGDFATSGEEVLFHEYAHHLMRQYFPGNYPLWYVEGFAEFLSTARMEGQNNVQIGHPPSGRVPFLRYGRWLPFRQLLTRETDNIGMLYAQGWLVTHWAFSDPTIEAHLRSYLRAIQQGATASDAYDASFGTEDRRYDRELERYMRRDLRAMGFTLPQRPPTPVEVERISDTEAEIALLYARRGEEGLGIAEEVAVDNPDDVQALTELAWLRLQNSDAQGALEAARAAQALGSDLAEPNLFAGMALLRLARDAGDSRDPRWREARELIAQANQLGPGSALVLYNFYRAYPSPDAATDNAREALEAAYFLLPQSTEIRMAFGAELIRQDRFDDADTVLAPLYQSPHGYADENGSASQLQRLREAIAAGRQRADGNETGEEAVTEIE
ncbi:MAG: hypothetical protein AAGE05_15780 [Pseudomonadota bacterium]